MKKYIFFSLILVLIYSCKKEKVETYSGKDGITFTIAKYATDSMSYSFAFNTQVKTRDTIYLNLRVVGAAANRDRSVVMKPGAGSTARLGVDYILPVATVPAGQLTLKYPLILLNSPEMATRSFRLIAELAPSTDFEADSLGLESGVAGTTSTHRIKVEITNTILKPGYWTSVQSSFGTFSVTKFRFMISVTRLTDFSQEAIGISGIYNIPVQLNNALAEYEEINGPLIDEFGNQVTF